MQGPKGVVSFPKWVPETELRSSVWATSILNHWAMAPAHKNIHASCFHDTSVFIILHLLYLCHCISIRFPFPNQCRQSLDPETRFYYGAHTALNSGSAYLCLQGLGLETWTTVPGFNLFRLQSLLKPIILSFVLYDFLLFFSFVPTEYLKTFKFPCWVRGNACVYVCVCVHIFVCEHMCVSMYSAHH